MRGWWDGEIGSPERATYLSESDVTAVIGIANDSYRNDPFKVILVSQGSYPAPEVVYAINVYNLETGNLGAVQQGFKETLVIRPFHNQEIVFNNFYIPRFARH